MKAYIMPTFCHMTLLCQDLAPTWQRGEHIKAANERSRSHKPKSSSLVGLGAVSLEPTWANLKNIISRLP